MALKNCKECNKEIGSKVIKCIHCGTDQRNWYDKHPLLLVMSLSFIFVFIYNVFHEYKNQGESNPIPRDPVSDAVNTIIDDDNTTISASEFQQLKSGMTYKEVINIIGCEGTVMSETGNPGEQFHTVMYTWKGHGGLGANANAMFQGGKLINKAQLGLQ